MSSLRQARTRTSSKNSPINPPAVANATTATTEGRNRCAAARAPIARRAVAVRPTVAGMRALQEALDAQRQEGEEPREQLRHFIAGNGNGGEVWRTNREEPEPERSWSRTGRRRRLRDQEQENEQDQGGGQDHDQDCSDTQYGT